MSLNVDFSWRFNLYFSIFIYVTSLLHKQHSSRNEAGLGARPAAVLAVVLVTAELVLDHLLAVLVRGTVDAQLAGAVLNANALKQD